MSMLEFLYNANPWWEGKKVSFPFKRMLYYNIMDFVRRCVRSNSLVIVGPRRTGKTIVLYQVAEKLFNENISAIYVPVDELVELKIGRIVDVINYYLRNLRHYKESVFLLDEVQFYKGWSKEIKILIDRFRRREEKILFVCTGSSALGVMLGAGEALIGRLNIFRMYPMSPLEVLALKTQDNLLIRNAWQKRFFIAQNALTNPSKVMEFVYRELGSDVVSKVIRVIMDTLYYGSLPETLDLINRGYSDLEIKKRLLEIIDLTIFRDILRLQKLYGSRYELDPEEASKIIKASIALAPHSASINSISTTLGITKEKVKLALKLAEYAGLIGILDQYSKSPITTARKRTIKIHVIDNGIRSATKNIRKDDLIRNPTEQGKALENLIISRLYPIQHTLGDPNPKVMFWERKIYGKKYEIDTIINLMGESIAIEVKLKETKSKSLRVIKEAVPKAKTVKISLDDPETIIPMALL